MRPAPAQSLYTVKLRFHAVCMFARMSQHSSRRGSHTTKSSTSSSSSSSSLPSSDHHPTTIKDRNHSTLSSTRQREQQQRQPSLASRLTRRVVWSAKMAKVSLHRQSATISRSGEGSSDTIAADDKALMPPGLPHSTAASPMLATSPSTSSSAVSGTSTPAVGAAQSSTVLASKLSQTLHKMHLRSSTSSARSTSSNSRHPSRRGTGHSTGSSQNGDDELGAKLLPHSSLRASLQHQGAATCCGSTLHYNGTSSINSSSGHTPIASPCAAVPHALSGQQLHEDQEEAEELASWELQHNVPLAADADLSGCRPLIPTCTGAPRPEITPWEEDDTDDASEQPAQRLHTSKGHKGSCGSSSKCVSYSSRVSDDAAGGCDAAAGVAMPAQINRSSSSSFTTTCYSTIKGQKVVVVRSGRVIVSVFVQEPSGEVWECPVDQVIIPASNGGGGGDGASGHQGVDTTSSSSNSRTIAAAVTAAVGAAAPLSAQAAAKLVRCLNGGTRTAECSNRAVKRVSSTNSMPCSTADSGRMRPGSSAYCSAGCRQTGSITGSCRCCTTEQPYSATPGASGSVPVCNCNSSSRSSNATTGSHACGWDSNTSSTDTRWPFFGLLFALPKAERQLRQAAKSRCAASAYIDSLDAAAHEAIRGAGCDSFVLPRYWSRPKDVQQQRRLRVLLLAYRA